VKEVMSAKKDLLEALGIQMHHDAITGTSKNYIARDYTIRINKALEQSLPVYRKELEEALQ
jgi:hypothetical protein